MNVCCNSLALASLPTWGDLEGWFLQKYTFICFIEKKT